ncbi:MAG: o-succinylbenzoate synthase [Acidimicrobiia bacterium]
MPADPAEHPPLEGEVVGQVTAVELHRVRIPLVSPFRTAHGVQHDRDVVLLAVRDREGRAGWGECVAMNSPTYSAEYADGAAHVLEHHLVPCVLDGGDARTIAGHPMAKAALEAALLDLGLQRVGRRLADELGGHGGPVAVGAVVGIAPSIEELLAQVSRRVAEGYTRIKLKIRPGWDREPLAAVRAGHPSLALWADANGDYTEEHLAHLCTLDEFGLGLVEQPFGDDELLLHAALAEALTTLVCLDESVTSVGSLRTAIELGACGVLNVKPGRVGGLRIAAQLVAICREHGVDAWCGGMLETGVGRAANLALATLPGMTLPGDLSASARYFERDLTPPFELGPGGTLTPPPGPGVGIAPDPAALAAFTTSVRTIHP